MIDLSLKPLVFVVDDDDTSLFILKKYIDRKKLFEIHTFDSGEACMNNITLNPELVVLDYYLTQSGSRMNGGDVVAAIKKTGKNPRIVMLSGQEDGQIVLNLINEGVRDYVIKGENAFAELDDILNDFMRERAGEKK
jgi:response regulator of citrate/malate metabolism